MKKYLLLLVLLVVLISCKKKDACDGNGVVNFINSSQVTVEIETDRFNCYFLTPGQSKKISIPTGSHKCVFETVSGLFIKVSINVFLSECETVTLTYNGK
jgi:hypothetical protein